MHFPVTGYLRLKFESPYLQDLCFRIIEDGTISSIHGRLRQWSSLSRVRSFIQHSEIKEGIERCNRDIDNCMKKFNVRLPSHRLSVCSCVHNHYLDFSEYGSEEGADRFLCHSRARSERIARYSPDYCQGYG
jgi:hypothetical protein